MTVPLIWAPWRYDEAQPTRIESFVIINLPRDMTAWFRRHDRERVWALTAPRSDA